jgi:glycosyltransferase involved in cell wall biosynthesis
LIVIDQSNGKTDFSSVKDKIHLHIKTYRNLGFAKAANYGIRLADTKYVTILNDDVEFLNIRWWDGIIETFNKYPEAVAVNPSSMRRLNAVGHPEDYPGFPYKESYTDEEYQAMVDECSRVGEEVRKNGIFIDGVTPWCVIFERESLLKIGLFDESYFPGGGEDYDFMNRCYYYGKAEKEKGNIVRHRWIGTSLSVAWHWWLTTKKTQDISKNFIEASDFYKKKWGTEEHPNPYPMGNQGKKPDEIDMPQYVIKEL